MLSPVSLQSSPFSRSTPCILAAALAVLGALPASAQEWKGRGRAQGKVVDTKNEPIGGATVHLLFEGQEGNGPDSLTTKKNGRWAYMGLSTATFVVRVEAEGYLESEGRIRVNEYATDKPVEVTLRSLEEGPAEAPADSVGGQLSALVDEGNQLMTEKKFGEARSRFEQALGQIEDPTQKAGLERAVAASYLEEGNFAEATSRFKTLLAASSDPQTQSDILGALGRASYGSGNVDGAVEHLQAALDLVPDDPQTTRLLVDILVGAGREAEAQPYMAKLPEGEKVDADAMLNLGIAAYNANDLETALEKFNKVANDYPDNANAHYYLGLSYMGSMKNAEAVKHFERMLELEPDHESAGDAKSFLDYLKTL